MNINARERNKLQARRFLRDVIFVKFIADIKTFNNNPERKI